MDGLETILTFSWVGEMRLQYLFSRCNVTMHARFALFGSKR